MATFNNFLQGVATQVTNTALKRVAGNLPGINNSYPYVNNSSRGGESSDQLPLAPRGNFQHYTFPLDVMAEPGLGNQGHYMMFYINQQENVKIKYSSIVINDDHNQVDFRIEGDTDSYLFFTDGDKDVVNVGYNSFNSGFESKLNIDGDVYINTHITASGDISSSGTITATSFVGEIYGGSF